MKTKYKANLKSTPKYSSEEDEDQIFKNIPSQLGYFRKTQTAQCIQVSIDEEIKEASYYRQVAQDIRDTSEGDIIEFDICSPGGRLDGLQVLLSAIYSTPAETIAKINGDCSSAASMLALHCDGVVVSPFATMLVHNVSYATGYSKNADIKNMVEHISEYSEKLFRDTYEYFLTEEEIVKCLDGLQLYLNADQISERLRIKFQKMKQEQEEQEELEDELEGDPCGNCPGCNDTDCSGNSDADTTGSFDSIPLAFPDEVTKEKPAKKTSKKTKL
jgi:ATP-dependent protease ClpP protease subunit